MKERNKEIDHIKGVAIFLVVYGHVIQYTASSYDFFNNKMFQLIYMFHMPLFALISGYLFYGANVQNSKEIIIDKFKRLIIPCVSWTIILEGTKLVIKGILGKNENIVLEIFRIGKSIPFSLWFLWGIFYSVILILIVEKFFKGYIKVYILSLVILMMIPDIINSHLYKYIMFYFILGYKLKQNSENLNEIYIKYKYIIILGFCICFILWNKETYIYNSGIYLFGESTTLKQIWINIVRYTSGILGSFILIGIVSKISQVRNKINEFFEKIGKQTMGIYIISGYMMIIIEQIKIPNKNIDIHILIICIIITIIIIGLNLSILKIIRNGRYLNKYLLGCFKNSLNQVSPKLEKTNVK